MQGGAGMDGQTDAEPGERLEQQREGAEGAEGAEEQGRLWKQGGQPRSSLHLVSALAQWVLLLACLIYLGVHLLRPSKIQSDKVLWTHIRYSGRSTRGAAVNLSAELGPIQIRNGSVLVPCDGLYLLSLRSTIYLEEKEDWLNLTLQGSSSVLWEQIVQSNESTVNLTTVLYLFEQDSITLWTSSNASLGDLSLSLVLVADSKS